MLVFDMSYINTPNMTFLLQIDVDQPTHTRYFTNKKTFFFQFEVLRCIPRRIVDMTLEDYAFSNTTVLQYWMNNGTIEIENPFEKLLNYTPYCDPQFHFVEMSLNYAYAPPVDITSPLKKGNDKLLKLVYHNPGNSSFIISATSSTDIGLMRY